ncbi:MAG TPA: hypothetical protein VGN07_03070 [Steroidobacteraceae bacterium]|jgi:hypothetical protein
MLDNVVFFIALLATALALAAALAHALELPNKIQLGRDAYFTVQQNYRGWDRLAWLLLIQLLTTATVALRSRHSPAVLLSALAAILCLLAAQTLFWSYTYPANVATVNWTTQPDNWMTLRKQWEYSHAGGAAFQVLAVSFLIVAALARTGR